MRRVGAVGGSGIGLVNKVTTQEGVAFTLYVGLADADTGAQELSFDEAKALATPLVSATGEGYTVIEAQGGYTDDAGNLVENGTLVYTGVHAGEQEVLGLVDDLKAALHVESVYVTSAQQGYAIYGGTIAFGGVERREEGHHRSGAKGSAARVSARAAACGEGRLHLPSARRADAPPAAGCTR